MVFRFCIAALLTLASTDARGAEVLERGIFTVVCDARDLPHAERALTALEAAAREFAPRLPAGDAPIRVLIPGSLRAFNHETRRAASGEVAGVARPARGEIVLKSPRLRGAGEDFTGTVRHELVHILLHRNGVAEGLPKWLNEGICMSLANEYRWAAPIHVAQMYLGGRIIPLHQLDLAFMAPGSEMEFGDAYAQALSMTRHLRDHLGEARFWAVVMGVRDLDFLESMQAHGGLTPGEFWKDYQASLWWVALVGTLASGSVLGPAWVILIVAWIRRRYRDRRILRRWAREEAEEEDVFRWEMVTEDPEAWKHDDDGEDDPWKSSVSR